VIHLDTSFLIRALMHDTAEQMLLDRWVASSSLLAVSAPAWAEFLCGPLRPGQARAASDILGVPMPLDEPAAALAADLFNHAGRRRGSLVDCMIAAVALRHGAAVATANRQDFERFTAFGLSLAQR
jgi:predicted nucleic acid-binding protein